MEEIISSHLREIEISEKVKIVYACESGSRAWGFPSMDSDYDVRFLYLRPVEWYLSIDEKRDVIERPVNAGLDINGWDLKKALQLFRKSNPPLLEWLGSPIIYLERYSVVAQMRELTSVYYSPSACLYHYLHMARGNFREYLKGEEVWVKKYFYVLRPILAMNWIEKELGVVPTDFNVLVGELITEPKLKTEVHHLLAAKHAGAELDRAPRNEPISRFIERELERLETYEITNHKRPAFADKLDELFRASLVEVWQS
jgi:predicted nucleotidyltransferase